MCRPSHDRMAPHAVDSRDAGSRVHPEPVDPLRGPFELDRHRIIESTAFRRLEHKTQVFAPGHHDHFRTRLTHTLEVAQIARCVATGLRANESLAEAISLAHDLGHPPFGHAGEAALDEAMAHHGGFNHNTHALRVVDYLEHPFPPFRGLNLTNETRAGLVTHATRYDRPACADETQIRAAGFSPRGDADQSKPTAPGRPRGLKPAAQVDYQETLFTNPTVEAQIVSIADRIAYNCHDLEDAIGAEFAVLDELAALDLWRDAYDQATRGREGLPIFAVRRVVLDALLDRLLTDVLETSRSLLGAGRSAPEVGSSPIPSVKLSSAVDAQLGELERFLTERVYQHAEVAKTDAGGRRTILELFAAYRATPAALPDRFAKRIPGQGPERVICDYIAGMTDRFCQAEGDRLVGRT